MPQEYSPLSAGPKEQCAVCDPEHKTRKPKKDSYKVGSRKSKSAQGINQTDAKGDLPEVDWLKNMVKNTKA